MDDKDILMYLDEARPLYIERKRKREVTRKTAFAALTASICCMIVAFMPTVQNVDGFSFVLYDDEAFNAWLPDDTYAYASDYGVIPLDNYGLLALNQ